MCVCARLIYFCFRLALNRWDCLCRVQEAELERLSSARDAETKYTREQNELETDKTQKLATIESNKFRSMIEVIGVDTIKAIATAGPELQVCCND